MYEPLMYEIDITKRYPPTVNEFEEFIEIGKVENENFNRVRIDLLQLFSMRFVNFTDEVGIARWEKMLKLKRRASDDLEIRRMRVLAKINNKLPYTWRTLHQLMTSFYGEGNYKLDLDPQEFTLEILIPTHTKTYNELIGILEPMVPLNIYMIIAEGVLKDMLQLIFGTYGWVFNSRVCGRFKTASVDAAIGKERLGIQDEPYAFLVSGPTCGRFRAGGGRA